MSGGSRHILLAAGGTGGHMFPAEATARALLARGHHVMLITDRRGADHTGRLAGVEIRVIAAGGVAGRAVLKRAIAAGNLVLGFGQALALVARQKPGAVLGFGGYATLPTMAAAMTLRVPAALHEQNAVLGRANRLLAPRVHMIATSFARTKAMRQVDQAKVVVTGNPVRPEIAALAGATYPPFEEQNGIRLLVTGGSQGARVFGHLVPAAVSRLPESMRARLRVDQQARPKDLDTVTAAYRDCGVRAEVAPFFHDIPQRLATCHLLIARSGASTVAELTAAGRPAILVPYPHAIDNHQTANAAAIAEAGAAWLMPEAGLDAAGLAERLRALIERPETLTAAARRARAIGRADAAERLAALVERLLPANGGRDPLKVAAE
ncbi:MAG TPA: undecaprenyldiphospho-muramoylpentapeptide beta-N-acetylglucosaminyltransferase [Alphaproteobacteria bacterium]|nr:undecaprenyldiphospho-muramoylpentapeptide beta-N-acetylglucosaminyltransferase [Alphaproteobacteria bacterium]